jgi:hypothetical protein
MILPTEKHAPKVQNPRLLVAYGKPKTGKTTLAANLENNLIVDLEGGSEFLSAMAVQIRSMADIGELVKAIKEVIASTGKKPYKYITIDNATRLEELCLGYARQLYNNTPQGKEFKGDVRTLPQGGGYYYLRQAVRKVIDMFRELCDTLILIGHVRDKQINKEGEELTELGLDLAGKLADIVCGEADAVCLIYRKGNQTIMSFEGGDNSIKEARAPHLRGQKIVVAESDANNDIIVHWDRIFLPENE